MIADNEGVRVQNVSACILCGAMGELFYNNMRDRHFGAPGLWNFYRCMNENCRLCWLAPQPLPEDIGKLYPGKYFTHKVPELRKANLFLRRIKRRLAGKALLSNMYLHGVGKGKLLDIGCGSGFFLSEMRDIGWNVEGIDIDADAVKVAREHFNLSAYEGTLESQNFSDNSFNAITMNHVIEHVCDPSALLKECYRILKPGGRILITCPNTDSFGHMLFKKSWYPLEPPRHLHMFSGRNLKFVVEMADFKVIATRTAVTGARQIYCGSKTIHKGDKLYPGYFAKAGFDVRALIFQLTEFLLLFLKGDAGEELVLIGEKDE